MRALSLAILISLFLPNCSFSVEKKGTPTKGKSNEEKIKEALKKIKDQGIVDKSASKKTPAKPDNSLKKPPTFANSDVTVRVIDGVEHYFYGKNDVGDVIAKNRERVEQIDQKIEDVQSRLASTQDKAVRIKLLRSIDELKKDRGGAQYMIDKYTTILKNAGHELPGTDADAPPGSVEPGTGGAQPNSSNNSGTSSNSSENTPLSEAEREESEEARARLEETNLDSNFRDQMSENKPGIGSALGNGADRLAASNLPDAMGRGPSQGPSFAPRPGGTGNAANPATKSDLLLASVSGYGGAFKRRGLQAAVGPDGDAMISRKDGTAATPREIARLRREIESEPEALMKRPDFFKVLPRASFSQLKTEYGSHQGEDFAPFRHVGLKRDFRWTESCKKLSGNCNSNSASLFYKKDAFVDPEDLASILDSIEAAEDDPGVDPNVLNARNKLGRRQFDGRKKTGLLSRLMGALGNLTGYSRGESGGDGLEVRGGGVARADGKSRYPVNSVESDVVPRGGKRLPPEVPDPGRGARRILLWIAILSASGSLFMFGLSRRDREDSD